MSPLYRRTLVAAVRATTVLEAAADTLAAVQFEAKVEAPVDGEVLKEIAEAHAAALRASVRIREISRSERFRRLGLDQQPST